MSAIVSGNGTGLLNSSAALLGQRGLIGNASTGRNGEAAYVNVATGNLVLQDRDSFLASTGLDLALNRTYNAQGKFNDDNGDNWKFGLHKQVTGLTGAVNTIDSTITRIDGDGTVSVYSWDQARQLYRSSDGAGAFDTLSLSGTNWLWTDGSSGIQESYDSTNNGRIISSNDPEGNALSFIYGDNGLLRRVNDASGESTLFTYIGNQVSEASVALKGHLQSRTMVTPVAHWPWPFTVIGPNVLSIKRIWLMLRNISKKRKASIRIWSK
ncbi:MAG: hypothetical protein RL748_3668 [Pseudomonadota bacterium]|jgi:YD repeat-containing protein